MDGVGLEQCDVRDQEHEEKQTCNSRAHQFWFEAQADVNPGLKVLHELGTEEEGKALALNDDVRGCGLNHQVMRIGYHGSVLKAKQHVGQQDQPSGRTALH